VPDAIVSDLNQPEFEGYDMTHLLRGQFQWRLFQQVPGLRQQFERKVEIALQYEHLRGRFGRTPLILTSSGPTPDWELKKLDESGFGAWELANAEILHYKNALAKADEFFVVEPTYVGRNLEKVVGMEALIQYLRRKLIVGVEG